MSCLIVRHPLYVGWFLIFRGTPSMNFGHLRFALGMSGFSREGPRNAKICNAVPGASAGPALA